MNEESLNDRLSRISTVWTLVAQARGGPQSAESAAQQRLLERYQGAAYRYLLGGVRDPNVADELFQDFALRFVSGAFRHADPGRGRFRDYLRRALGHLITNYRIRQQRQKRQTDQIEPNEVAAPPEPGEEERFLEDWRTALLDRTWEALAALQQPGGAPYHVVLRHSYESPQVPSQQLAEELNARIQPATPFSAAGLRKTLQRARDLFAGLLVDEVGRSIEATSLEELEEELGTLGLLSYCKKALERRR